MRHTSALYGLGSLLLAGSAHATVLPGNALYSSFITNLPDQAANPNFPVATGAIGSPGSPLAQEFTVTSPFAITSLDIRLSDPTAATDGGSVLVYLVPGNGTLSLPATTSPTSNKLAGKTLLATIADSSIPVPGVGGCIFGGAAATINKCNTLVVVNDYISTPGDYWIALVDGSDTNNGGANTVASGAVWWRAGDNVGLNNIGLTNAHVNANDVLTSQVHPPNAFELQVNTVEPASVAILAAGVTGLTLVRRRPKKSSVT
jgi:hypothetical protein